MAVQTERGIPLSALSSNFLHTNSTSHTWPFGAIAELIDNAYDPDVDAKQLWIDQMEIRDQDCLVFMDNGKGMDYDKMHKMLSFGFSDKPVIDGHVPVGIYGNGFKSGSMRLGDDAIVFSKKSSNMCVGLLSQTYLKKTKAEHIVVPIVEFTYDGTNISPVAEHSASLEDILRYSLFQTETELHSELMAINGPYSTDSAGTRIIIWNLRKTSSGTSEFDFRKDRYDIIIPDDVLENSKEQYQHMECATQSVPESNCSLRAYCSILYLKPRMQIIIRGQKVRTQLISKSLAFIQKDRYKPQFLQEALSITFGYNTKSKEQYGIMMYHKNRLIKAYERVGCQLKANKTGVGIIGVIECNYLKPTHNKQDFNFTEEYRKTIYNVAIKLEEYWKEVQHRRQRPNCSVPVEDIVKQPDQNWVQCDSCLKWRKLPDGIDIDQLPEKWYCHKNPYHQFRSCDVLEESEDSDDEQPTYQKTYKKHEKNKMKQQEMTKKKMEEEKIARLKKKNAALKRKQQDLEHQLKLTSSARSPTQATAILSSNSSLLTSSVIPNISRLSTTPTRKKRTMFLSQENLAAKRFRMKSLDSNMPSSPSASTPSPETQPVVSGQPLKDETWPGDSSDDDDITIVESKRSPRPKPWTFDLSKVKSEQQAVGDDATLETSMAVENSDDLDLSFCPPTEQVSATTQTSSTPHLKLEEDSQESRDRTNKQDRDSLQSERDQCLRQVENRPNQESQAMNQGSSSYKSNCDAANQMENMKSKLQDSEPNSSSFETQTEVETEKISVKLPDPSLDLPNKEHWSMLDAQQQQDSLLELLEATSQERDSNWAQVQVLTSRMEDLGGKLFQLSQSKVKKMCEQSTQTSSTEEGDYRELYLQASKELEDLRNKLERERAEWTALVEREKNGTLLKRGQTGLKDTEVDDELACQIDLLLRELDKRNQEQEELKHKLDSLEGERQTLLTCCESMQKDLEEIKKENKEVKTNLEHCEAQIEVPNVYQEEREVVPAETRNSWTTSQLKANQGETLGGAESEMNQGNENTETLSLRLRELRQKVARLLVTFVPALELEQINYDCNVVEEILTSVIDEISPNDAPSN